MTALSRTQNTIINFVANIGAQLAAILLSFLTRIIFIKVFGENYLGINGLFSNILSILSLAELGFSGAIVYCMYKPLAERDYQYLAALMNYYKKIYSIIGAIVCVIGLLVVPFLKYLVNIKADIGNITYYYLLYLLNTVSTYFFVYKTSILNADQKSYIIKICKTAVLFVQFIVLSIVALLLKNFYIYLTLQIVFSISINVSCSAIASRKYPFLKSKAQLNQTDKKKIWSNVVAMLQYQIGGVFLNNTANILISVLVSTVAVGFYSNYYMFIASVNVFTQLVFSSVSASIGNLFADGGQDKILKIFNTLELLAFWITFFCVVSFCILFQDSIEFLYGKYYLLNYNIVIVCSFNFYILNILHPIYCFRNTVGLFKHVRYIMLITGVVNLVLSILFGRLFGLFGILLASGISRILTNYWYEPVKLYSIFFKTNVVPYFARQFIYLIFTISFIFLMTFVVKPLDGMSVLTRLSIKILLCLIVPNLLMFLFFRKTQSFDYLKNSLIKQICRHTYVI